jgi:uncharacterized protein (TIGR02246 family)
MKTCASVKPYALIGAIDIRLPLSAMLCAAMLCVPHARADTPQPACTKLTTLQVMQLMNTWKAGLASGDADKMASFYAEDATLATTRSGGPFKGRDAIRIYYGDLLPRHPAPRFLSSKISATCNAATVEGFVLYRITGKRKGTRMLLGGHYKVDFALHEGNVWLIKNQSLAADPRKLDEPIASL